LKKLAAAAKRAASTDGKLDMEDYKAAGFDDKEAAEVSRMVYQMHQNNDR
jgi:hypothetical protein